MSPKSTVPWAAYFFFSLPPSLYPFLPSSKGVFQPTFSTPCTTLFPCTLSFSYASYGFMGSFSFSFSSSFSSTFLPASSFHHATFPADVHFFFLFSFFFIHSSLECIPPLLSHFDSSAIGHSGPFPGCFFLGLSGPCPRCLFQRFSGPFPGCFCFFCLYSPSTPIPYDNSSF